MKLLLSTLVLVACTGASAQTRQDFLAMQREALDMQREALEQQRESVRMQRNALEEQRTDTLMRQIQDSQFQEYRDCVANRSLFCVRPIRF